MDRTEYDQRLSRLFNAVQEVSIWIEAVRLVAVLYLFILMLKFFKQRT